MANQADGTSPSMRTKLVIPPRASVSGNREGTANELLRLLRRDSPMSRADLVRSSGLTAPTVSAGIAKLMRRNLVVELGHGSSNGGRPPGLLDFNTRYGYVVGVDIGGSFVRVALADLKGSVAGRWNARLKADRNPTLLTRTVAEAVTQLLRQHKIPGKRVLEVVAGAPGITDVTAGRVLSAPNLTGWHDVPFRDMLQRELRIPVTIENDVNLGALGEGWRGAAKGAANFVFLAVGTGVGAGIVLNHALHHGAKWSAGEVGYMLLPGLPDDPPGADELGALESAVGGKSIEENWGGHPDRADRSRKMKATDIFDLAATGDSNARGVMMSVAHYLAMAITNLSLVLDLSTVVLGGGVGEHPALLEAIRRNLEKNEFARPQLVMSSLGGEAQIWGAIWLALRTCEANGFRRRSLEAEIATPAPGVLTGT
jgi:glucokinase